MDLNLPLVHLNAPRAPRETVYITGTHKGIRALIAALMAALECGVGQAELSAGASNPYAVHVLMIYDLDSPTWRNMVRRSLAPWRRRPASDKQKALLDRYGTPYTPATTAGEAVEALAGHLARRNHPE